MRIYCFAVSTILLCTSAITSIQAQVLSTVLIEKSSGGLWKNSGDDTGYIYNSDCNEIYGLSRLWDSTSNSWDNYVQTFTSYYTSGKLDQDSLQQWNTPAAGWNNFYLETNTYDGSNYLISHSDKSWSTATSNWQNSSQTDYTNNTDGTHHIGYILSWSGSVWDTLSMITYIYNIPGQLDTALAIVQISPGVWQNSQLTYYTYISGAQTSAVTQSWLTASNSWQNAGLVNYFPNATLPDSNINSSWNTATNVWYTLGKQIYTYTPCTPAAVRQINPADPIAIYPNPSTGRFTITGLIQGQTVEIYNYTGQRIDSRIVDNTAMDLSIAAYASGMYLVRVHNQDGSMAVQKKIIKIQ